LLGGTLLHISQNPNNLVSPHSFT